MRSVKVIICSEEYDIDWGEGMSCCRRQQFLQYDKAQESCGGENWTYHRLKHHRSQIDLGDDILNPHDLRRLY